MANPKVETRHRVEGAPNTVQVLHIVAAIGFFVPVLCLAPLVFIVPILLLTGQISATWQDFLGFLLIPLGIGILFIVYRDMEHVIDIYRFVDHIRSELEAKDPDSLTMAEHNLLAFYRYGGRLGDLS